MSKLSVVQPTTNGKKPLAKVAPKTTLADLADDLYELRTLLKKSTEAERKLTAEVLEGMHRVGADRIEGAIGVAILGERTTLTPDVGLFIGALGARAHAALSVKIEAARALMAADDLAAISESSTTPILRVQPIGEGLGR
jgi:hypothetical protein